MPGISGIVEQPSGSLNLLHDRRTMPFSASVNETHRQIIIIVIIFWPTSTKPVGVNMKLSNVQMHTMRGPWA